MGGVEAADRCPYRRPFPAGFDGCPTYQAQLFIPLTSDNRLLPAVRSCVFLTVAGQADGGFYARCELGTAADRARWLADKDPEKLELLKRFRQGLSVAVRDTAERMWVLKGAQLQARAGSDLETERQTTLELARATEAFQEVIDDFLERQSGLLQELDVEPAEAKELIRALLDDMVVGRAASSGPVPVAPRVLARFRPQVRALFAPYEAASRVPTAD